MASIVAAMRYWIRATVKPGKALEELKAYPNRLSLSEPVDSLAVRYLLLDNRPRLLLHSTSIGNRALDSY